MRTGLKISIDFLIIYIIFSQLLVPAFLHSCLMVEIGQLYMISTEDKIEERYGKKINESISTFKRPADIEIPRFRILKTELPYAGYSIDHDFIMISSCLVEELPKEELGAVIAHEIEHAREVYKKRGLKDDRPEWKVDVGATKLVEKRYMISAISNVVSKTGKYIRKKHQVVCILFPFNIMGIEIAHLDRLEKIKNNNP